MLFSRQCQVCGASSLIERHRTNFLVSCLQSPEQKRFPGKCSHFLIFFLGATCVVYVLWSVTSTCRLKFSSLAWFSLTIASFGILLIFGRGLTVKYTTLSSLGNITSGFARVFRSAVPELSCFAFQWTFGCGYSWQGVFVFYVRALFVAQSQIHSLGLEHL